MHFNWFVTLPVRKSKHLQIEDLLRHGGSSRAKQKSKFHQKALAYHLASSVVLPKSPPPVDDPDMPVSSLQVLLAWETLFAPTGPPKTRLPRSLCSSAQAFPTAVPFGEVQLLL